MTLPTFEQIAQIESLDLDVIETVTIRQLCKLVNKRVESFVQFGEYGFTPLISDRDADAALPCYRWLDVAAVRGGNEGYYIHITVVPSRHDRDASKLIATAKVWSWADALAIAAIATKLLNV